MATRSGVSTGRVAIPREFLTIPGSTINLGPQPAGSLIDPLQVIPEVRFGLAAPTAGASIPTGGTNLGELSPMPFFNSGFQPTFGGSVSGGIWPDIIDVAGNIATAIINRGNQPQQIPTMTGGTLPLPGFPPGTVPNEIGPPGGYGMTTGKLTAQDVQLVAQAPMGGWPTTKDGRPRRVRKDGRPWKRPSMNPTNPRALGRAMRRVNGFAQVAKRTISFTKRVKMKRRKRT